jgi:hypothetical protein
MHPDRKFIRTCSLFPPLGLWLGVFFNLHVTFVGSRDPLPAHHPGRSKTLPNEHKIAARPLFTRPKGIFLPNFAFNTSTSVPRQIQKHKFHNGFLQGPRQAGQGDPSPRPNRYETIPRLLPLAILSSIMVEILRLRLLAVRSTTTISPKSRSHIAIVSIYLLLFFWIGG